MIIHSLSADSPPSDSIPEAVVDAVSDIERCDPLTLPPLWDEIDPEALNGSFAPTRRGHPRAGRVAFDYAGYEVRVAVDVLGSEVVREAQSASRDDETPEASRTTPASQSEAAASDDGDETISVSLESLA
ncbi:hypothetical protein C477_03399 [Haloterrigena salina JCM 13891]|uniref:Halobacterial output domain-containing protein n=1 Tax=Haloterrigena salina JCM 13891 TaxID=1227488 RepID=M0CJK5_9EURY|nr:HalOD1 output domain-containing protein [Haloterrigena salina]ELZ22828.1 hypothetical protein C477_03399 [Haloterrigena salina JCM 13891]